MSDRGATFGRAGLAMAALILAVGVTVLMFPRVRASLAFLPVDTAISRYFDSGEIPSAQLAALTARAEAAIAIHPHYRYWDGLSFLNYLQALDQSERPWLQRPALHRSLTAGLEAVRRAPAKPRTWLRVARARAALGQAPEAVAEAFSLSILTGRVEPTLLMPRLELGYAYLDYLDAEARALLKDQTLLAWRVDERAFRRALGAGRLDLSRVKSVLGSNDSALLDDMERGT